MLHSATLLLIVGTRGVCTVRSTVIVQAQDHATELGVMGNVLGLNPVQYQPPARSVPVTNSAVPSTESRDGAQIPR